MKVFDFFQYYKGEGSNPFNGEENENENLEWYRELAFSREIEMNEGESSYLEMGAGLPSVLEDMGLLPELLKEIKALPEMEKAWFAFYFYHYPNQFPLPFTKKHGLVYEY